MVFITTQGQICLNKHTNSPQVPLAKRPLLWDHKHQQLLLHYEFRQISVLEQGEEADKENVKAIGFNTYFYEYKMFKCIFQYVEVLYELMNYFQSLASQSGTHGLVA